MSYGSYGFNNMSVSNEKTVRHPASSLLVIDSEDRNVASSINVSALSSVEYQPWNNFRIQTPDRLATGAIDRITLKSIRFPWYIPNITYLNGNLEVQINNTGPFYAYNVSPGFYSPEALALDMSQQQDTIGLEWKWDNINQSFYVIVTGSAVGVPIKFYAVSPTISYPNPLTNEQFLTNASLAKTLGFTAFGLSQSYTQAVSGGRIFPTGYTQCLYTRYVDIVSPRLLQYRRMIDGASKNASKKALITRVYCANETSTNSYDLSGNIIPVGTQPFLIHRKIWEKDILWNSEATVDYLDFQVYDEYGNLVQLPFTTYFSAPTTYPSFQMTFVLSE